MAGAPIRKRSGLRVVVAGAVALALSGCLSSPSPWAGDSGPYVGILGDSLVHAAETGGGLQENDPDHFLTEDMTAAGYHSSISAMLGAKTEDLAGVESFPEPRSQPEILVIGLGTNDRHEDDDGPVPVEEAVQNIVDFIDASAAECTALITIVDPPSWGLDVNAPPYNDALFALDASRADVIVADWETEADTHPEYFKTDLIHHTEAGKAAYREFIVDAAGSCAALIGP